MKDVPMVMASLYDNSGLIFHPSSTTYPCSGNMNRVPQVYRAEPGNEERVRGSNKPSSKKAIGPSL